MKNGPFKVTRKSLVYIVMAICTLVVLSVVVAGVQSSTNDNTKQLELLHVIVRHGARTPVDTYPKDPYINETFFPVGWGQLTNDGKRDLYDLGKYLRNRYGAFLGDFYTGDYYYAQSTDVERTLASVQLINAGLWRPGPTQQWGVLDWQPIPVHYEPLNEDALLLVRRPCPQYNIEFENVKRSEEIQELLKKNADLFEYLESSTGKSVKDFDDVQDLYTSLYAELSFNLSMPAWTRGYFPEKMEEATGFSYVLRAYNDKLNRLKGGLLLKKLINDWKDKTANKLKPKDRKAFLYGGHDSTIANLLSTLKVYDGHVPGYSVAIMLEFSRDKVTKTYGLEVYYRNSSSLPPHKLEIPGCKGFCPFDRFLELTKDVVPENWEKECATDDPNYVPPPPHGP